MSAALHVVFQVADAEYALPASEVVAMETYTGATRVPGAAAHVAGLIQIRGRVIPVVDLRARFGLPAKEVDLDSRVVVTQQGERTVALLVDRARRVLDLPPESFAPPPEVVVEHAAGFVTAVARVDGRLLMRLDLAKVIGEVEQHGE
jgi:purine-binding chemotaxis protein CheW